MVDFADRGWVLAANIDMAIRACREERGSLLQSKREMKVVKESLNDSYCDITGQAVDMALAGDMGGFKVFMARGTLHPPSHYPLLFTSLYRHRTAQSAHAAKARVASPLHPRHKASGGHLQIATFKFTHLLRHVWGDHRFQS